MSKYFYLFLISAVFVIPFVASFGHKFPFVKYWRGVFFGIAVMVLLFIPWNVWFASKDIWGWNQEMITGGKLGNLPLESLLYFISIPFAFCYLYERWRKFKPFHFGVQIEKRITAVVIFLSFVISIAFVDRLFTFTTCSLLSLFLIWHLLVLKSDYLSRFYFVFIVFQIPLFIVKGSLTGLFFDDAIVWYNPTEILGFNLLTIPIETIAYDMLMLLIVVTAYENFKVKRFSGALNVS